MMIGLNPRVTVVTINSTMNDALPRLARGTVCSVESEPFVMITTTVFLWLYVYGTGIGGVRYTLTLTPIHYCYTRSRVRRPNLLL